MAATKTVHHLLAIADRRLVDFDPGATADTLVDLVPASSDECLPIENFFRFLAGVMVSVGTGGISAFRVVAATDADGTGAVTVVSHAIGSSPNAVGDYVWLECDVEQVREALAAATHVGVFITLATATDECVVYFEQADPRWKRANLTADYIA